MNFYFISVKDLYLNNITPLEVIQKSSWEIQPHNAAYLMRRAKEPEHKIVELTEKETNLFDESISLRTKASPTSDEQIIIGDIGDRLSETAELIIARTCYFEEAQKRASLLGYVPAKAGEYLQILWGIKSRKNLKYGYNCCYAGRKVGYAILAIFDREGIDKIVFDVSLPNLEFVSMNMDSTCFFVKR